MVLPIQPQQYTLSGQVLRPDGTPLSENGASVRAFHQPATGQPILLGQASSRADGRYTLTYTPTK